MNLSIKIILENACLPRLETYIILGYILKKPKVWLIAHQETVLSTEQIREYNSVYQKRLKGIPIAYLIGYREFMNYTFHVNSNVLIPRPETEILVKKSLDILNKIEIPKVVDLGTGSGIIAISIALSRSDAFVSGSDINSYALTVAKNNAKRLGVNLRLLKGNWFTVFKKKEKFDLIVSNPPYVSRLDPHLEQGDLRFEPRDALTDNADGLSHIRCIIFNARFYLKPGGCLWMEHGWNQSKILRNLYKKYGYNNISSECDLSGIERISGGSFEGFEY
ncbi:MAG: peptide chain release factor N(5)-glutamine methyltransferase [Bordetella sp.]|nr:MAG: peptide chain release factor N(5)-glutamine methyltransferase [Bordetella sp.]